MAISICLLHHSCNKLQATTSYKSGSLSHCQNLTCQICWSTLFATVGAFPALQNMSVHAAHVESFHQVYDAEKCSWNICGTSKKTTKHVFTQQFSTVSWQDKIKRSCHRFRSFAISAIIIVHAAFLNIFILPKLKLSRSVFKCFRFFVPGALAGQNSLQPRQELHKGVLCRFKSVSPNLVSPNHF